MVNLRSIDQELNSLAKERGMLSTEVPKDVTDSWKDVFKMTWIHRGNLN